VRPRFHCGCIDATFFRDIPQCHKAQGLRGPSVPLAPSKTAEGDYRCCCPTLVMWTTNIKQSARAHDDVLKEMHKLARRLEQGVR
jgi:hypothetical protein